ncbi:unnamed protein product [Paramecium sonneborni]|uniref:Uncharacterized protein n=1 Tax=Paramecium sonneborni TaxID=65129 RepID=A0A8S1KGL8_9CILI|nr:unnamed protein product [Paramecium sonneborni]
MMNNIQNLKRVRFYERPYIVNNNLFKMILNFFQLEKIQNRSHNQKTLQTIALQLIGDEFQDLYVDLWMTQKQLIKMTKVHRQDINAQSIYDIIDAEFKAKRLSESITVYKAEINKKTKQILVFQADILREI